MVFFSIIKPVKPRNLYNIFYFQKIGNKLLKSLGIMNVQYNGPLCHSFRSIQVKRTDIYIMLLGNDLRNFTDESFFIHSLYPDTGQKSN